ncbi:hypothetical protein ABU614_15740 [Lysobacter firmicutimachus]|uniref:Uncharacterized protein n=1 Tax=Lysobacter firmicutimachus TaxID=1792846 RepID=A0AAU8MRU1_9GAMM
MRTNRSTARLAGALFAALLLPVSFAHAANQYCDNDRDPGQYPSCGNVAGAGFYYRSGQPSDYHGDDRLSTTQSSSYGWVFLGTVAAGHHYAYLANNAFTDPRAEYQAWDLGSGFYSIGYVNQNTAPSGWNYVGYGTSGALYVRRSSGSGATGADAVMRQYAGLSAQASTPLTPAPAGRCPSLALRDPALAELQNKMFDAARSYRDAAGSYAIVFNNNGQRERIEFEVSPARRSGFVRIAGADGRLTEHYADAESQTTVLPLHSAYRSSRRAAAPDAEQAPAAHAYRNTACQAVYASQPDASGAPGTADVLAPANYAFWLSDEDSRILGRPSLLGREAVLVEGRHDEAMARKLGAQRYRMWVDAATGILLKLEGRNARGGRAYLIEVERLRLDSGVSPRARPTLAKGWIDLGAAR